MYLKCSWPMAAKFLGLLPLTSVRSCGRPARSDSGDVCPDRNDASTAKVEAESVTDTTPEARRGIPDRVNCPTPNEYSMGG